MQIVQSSFCLYFLGTNCLLIKDDKTGLLVDPHFTRPRKHELLFKIQPDIEKVRQSLEKTHTSQLHAVLLTHTHYDHALDAANTALLTGAAVTGSQSAVNLGIGAGLPPQRLLLARPGEPYPVGTFTITFFRVTHLPFPTHLPDRIGLNGLISIPMAPPAWFWQYRSGEVYAILLEHNGFRLLIQGSAGVWIDDLHPVGVDAAVLSIGGLGLLPRSYFREWFDQNVQKPGIRQIYLSHWDDFTRPLKTPMQPLPGIRKTLQQLQRMAASGPDFSFELLQPNQWIDFNGE
jgi:L-ascorbate metabolism protein UlaG (beta-lactamase superfamily)